MLLSAVLSSGLLYAALVVALPSPLEERQTCPTASASYLQSVKTAFSKAKIVPQLIPSINPDVQVNVAYGSKQVNLGTVFTTLQTLNAPTVSFTGESNHPAASTKYTYFLIDPDVPMQGTPLTMTYLHWMVEHAQPGCITAQKPETVVLYEAPTPASNTQHRYTFLVYREPPGFEAKGDVLLNKRPGFNVNAYAAKKGLVLVGGNYFLEAITNT